MSTSLNDNMTTAAISPSTDNRTPAQQQTHMQPQQSSRKNVVVVSANHLLNFQLPPRQTRQHQYHSSSRTKSFSSSSSAVYNKERFVNANFRFILSPLGEYNNLVLDPDALVDWDSIEQVIIPTVDYQACPICLSAPPTAAKVGKCGHVFCYNCILHYLALSANRWAKCPICFDSVYAKDLRSARFQIIRDFSKLKADNSSQTNLINTQPMQSSASGGDRIVMRLMQRSSGSMTVLPRPFWSEWAMTGSPCCESADSIYLSFAKSIIGSPQFIQQAVLDAERSELEQSLREAKQLGDHEEALYLEMALSEIAGRQTVFNRQLPTLQESYLEKKSSQKIPSSLFLTLSSSFNNNNNNNSSLPVQFQFIPQASPLSLTPPALPMEDPFADLEQQAANELSSESEKVEQSVDSLSANFKGAMCLKVGSPSPLSPASLSNNNNNINNNINKPADGSMYYFYQAADGQPLYLHPLEIKILKSEYGSYDRFPDEICVRLSAITESTLTEDARKRYKYLAHLPLSCDVIFAEIDWHAPVGVNICRQLVTRSTAVSPLASPSTFTTLHPQSSPYTTSAVANNNNNKSPLPLVSADSLRRFEPELKARAKRRSTKLRKEEKEQARFRRNSLSAGTAASLSAAGGPTQPVAPPLSLQDYPSQSVNEQRQRSSADQIFDFDDERLWAPLPVSLGSAVSPPTQQQSNPSISTNSSAWHNQQLAPGQLSIERQFPTLATATSALASATKPSAPAASSPSPVSFAQALATRRDQELLIFGSPVSLPVNNISTSVPAAHQSSTATTAAANIVDGQLVVDEEPPSGKRSKSRRSKQIMLMRSSAGGRRAY